MSDNIFGDFVKARRSELRLSLRSFAEKAGMDPGNASRLERGRTPAPESLEVLGRIAEALQLAPKSKGYSDYMDAAATAKGRIPQDLLSDAEVASKLPVLFRTLRSKPLNSEQLEKLIETIRKA